MSDLERPRLLVLNPTSLEIAHRHRAEIESRGVELWADPAFATLDERGAMDLLVQVDAVILPAANRRLPEERHMRRCERLLTCAIAASGYEWVDIEAATRNGIVVSYAPGGMGAEVVADLTWALMLAAARQVPFHHQRLAGGDASRGMGRSVFGKTLGIIGLGQIGRAVARRASGFEVRVLASDPCATEQHARETGVELVTSEALFEASDFVSLHVRLSEATRGMIGAAELRRMKSTAYLINTARGELVDEAALADAIASGRIAGAGIDDPPATPAARGLFGNPSVVFTPHIGNRAIEGVTSVFRAAVENAMMVLRRQRPQHVVNPAVYETEMLRANRG